MAHYNYGFAQITRDQNPNRINSGAVDLLSDAPNHYNSLCLVVPQYKVNSLSLCAYVCSRHIIITIKHFGIFNLCMPDIV